MPKRKPDVVDRIASFNRGREPERLAIKYRMMAGDAHRFLRGTCHLFYEDWIASTVLDRAPAAWICGDLHLENFGSYKGDDRLLYFDINDFDESVLAPCTWELARVATSVLLVGADNKLTAKTSADLCRDFLRAYAAALQAGKAQQVEREIVQGMVRDLLDAVAKRRRADLLAERTELRGRVRRLRLGKRALPVTPAQRRALTGLMRRFAQGQERPGFFRALDVARRVAGTGSLGTERYVVLVEGNGSPAQNFLIEVKEGRASAIAPYTPCRQPRWSSHAERIVTIQYRMQAVTPALLHDVSMDGRPFVIKELQPSQDKLSLDGWRSCAESLPTAMETIGRVVGWAQLRSSGRQGSATADELIVFASERDWPSAILRYAQGYAHQVTKDWKAFRKAVESGRMKAAAG